MTSPAFVDPGRVDGQSRNRVSSVSGGIGAYRLDALQRLRPGCCLLDDGERAGGAPPITLTAYISTAEMGAAGVASRGLGRDTAMDRTVARTLTLDGGDEIAFGARAGALGAVPIGFGARRATGLPVPA